MHLPALLTTVALQVGTAHAAPATSAECPAPYTLDALLGHLVAVEEGLRGDDPTAAHAAARALEAGLPCLVELLPPLIAGRAYRAVAGGLAVAEAPDAGDRAAAWFRTAAELEPTFDYGLQDLPADHPVRDAYHAARATADVDAVAVEARGFDPATGYYLDGRRIDAPAARPDRPHLLQRDQGGVTSWLVEGAAFPDAVLARRVAAKAPAPSGDAGDEAAKQQARAARDEAAAAEQAAREQARAERDEARRLARAEKAAAKEAARAARAEAAAVADAAEPAAAPRATTALQTPPSGVVVLKRQRPPEKTPLLIGGGIVAALGGGLYALALDARGDFAAATHEDDVHRYARQANRLVLASAAALAVGAGTVTWGVVLEGGAPLPAIRLRF